MKNELLEVHKLIHTAALMSDAELLQVAEIAYSLSSRLTAEVLYRGVCIEFFPMNVTRGNKNDKGGN